MRFFVLQSMSIVVTGNPGVGKHTVAHEIAKNLDLPVIDINEIAKKSGLFEKISETNDVDIFELEKILEPKISKKAVIVGHLAPYVISKENTEKIIILRRSPYDLLEVYKERKYSDKKSKENTGSEILGVIAYDAFTKFQEKSFQVNVSGRTINEVTKITMDIISNKKINEQIDWLEVVEKNNDLKKFFVD